MANEDDFTFCNIAPSINDSEAQRVADEDDVKGIPVKDRITVSGNDISNNASIWNVTPSQRVETVGSLSFNVIDASSANDKQPKKTGEEASGSSTKSDAKAPKAKPVARAKVPFEKGYSQMDWLKLTQTHPDLAGLKGQSNTRLIPMSEVKQHRSEDSMWTVLKGRVYNITTYMKFHPGGDELMKGVGRDCTSLFNKHHAWVNAEFLLEKCLVGILDDGKKT